MATGVGGPFGSQVQNIYDQLQSLNVTKGIDNTRLGAADYVPPGGQGAESLGMQPPGQMSMDDLIVLLQALKSKVDNEQLKTAGEDVANAKELKRVSNQERMDKLVEAMEKAGKAKKGGLAGKIFGWIAAAAMIIAGALLVATGVGGAAGVALLVGGVTMAAVMALQQSGAMDKIMEGMSKLFEMMGMDPEEARIAATVTMGVVMIAAAAATMLIPGAGIAVAIGVAGTLLSSLFTPENLQKMGVPEDKAGHIALGLSIGLALVAVGASVGPAIASKVPAIAAKLSAVFGKTAGEATAQAAKTTAQVTQTATTATDVAKKTIEASKLMEAIAKSSGRSVDQVVMITKQLSYVAMGIQAAATVGGGVAAIDTSVKQKEAADASARVKEMEAELAKLQQLLQEESDRIEEIIKRLQEGADIVMTVMNQEDVTSKRIAAV